MALTMNLGYVANGLAVMLAVYFAIKVFGAKHEDERGGGGGTRRG